MNVEQLKLASWNVNSLKIRLEQVLQWLETTHTDILALQETKLVDELFPLQTFKDKGFNVVYSGQKTYNGVAIISRYPIEDVILEVPDFSDPQRRFLAATVAGIRVINIYVPNGSVVGSDKFVYKLTWLENVTNFIKKQLTLHPHLALLGDFNIAPEDRDVHNPAEWEGSVMVSPEEREAFTKLIALGLKDSLRKFNNEANQYSWWDYRAGSFRRNRGLRIDHILLSESLQWLCKECIIDVDPRRSKRPSDHTPILVTFNAS